MTSYSFFVTGHKGFETALFHEVREIIAPVADAHLKKVYGGLELEGTLELAYRISIYSRLANRIYLPLATFRADNEQALYEAVYNIDWSKHLTSRGSLAVSASLSRSDINHSHYASLKVKDAIVDYFRNTVNSRPIIEKERPDVHVHLNYYGTKRIVGMTESGDIAYVVWYPVTFPDSGANYTVLLVFQSITLKQGEYDPKTFGVYQNATERIGFKVGNMTLNNWDKYVPLAVVINNASYFGVHVYKENVPANAKLHRTIAAVVMAT